MRSKIFAAVLGAALTSGCVTTPNLSEVTGTSESHIFIKDVVQRVKCELSEAFDHKVDEPGFSWLSTWMAKVDLTLTINDNAGIAPTVTFTRFFQSVPNTHAGPNAIPQSKTFPFSFPLFSQTFALTAGANLNTQAVRTEAMSFTIALDELKRWRSSLDGAEGKLGYDDTKRVCNFDRRFGVTGNLGLKEWVESAFYPVEVGSLQAGVHTIANYKTPPVNAPPSAATKKDLTASQKTVADAKADVSAWHDYLAALTAALAAVNPSVDAAKSELAKAQSLIKARMDSMQPYQTVLAPYLKTRYGEVSALIRDYATDVELCVANKTRIAGLLSGAQKLADKLSSELAPLDDALFINKTPQGADYARLQESMAKVLASQSGTDLVKRPADAATNPFLVELKKCPAVVQALINLPYDLPEHVDPPIDAVTHTVNFVVTYGANVTPIWTLLQWKNGASGNLAQANGTRTHNLVIALAPRTGQPPISPDATRLILNQAIRAIGQ